MGVVFKYSTFYRWQLLIGLILPLAIIVFIIPAIHEQGISLSGIVIIGFCIFVTIYCLILHSKRLKDFNKLYVDDNGLQAVYRKKKSILITWQDAKITWHERGQRIKTIRVKSKIDREEIIVNSEVNDFDLLVEQIRKYTKIKNT
jgi:hypothetical protein